MAAPLALYGATKRPNLLLIMTDQQTHDALSCAGNKWVKTPAMDSLAANGVRFAQTICAYPVCSPSRGSIFTSRMPHETGVRLNAKAIADGIPTMGEIFRDAGYKTVYGGKWHLPKSFDGMTAFEKLIGGSGQGKDMDAPLAAACAKWLRNAPAEPFLMVASFMNPHDICEWIREHEGTHEYPDTASHPPIPANLAVDPDEPACIQYHRTAKYDLMSQAVAIASQWREADVRKYLHDYYRMVEDVDKQISILLDALREKKLDQNTIVIFVSDHGEGMCAHRWAQKASFYEESVRVPMIISGPGIKPRVDNQTLASLTDILPTFCDYAGIPAPKPIRGASLRKAIEGQPINRKFQVSELRYADETREGRMLRSAKYKYVVFNSGARPEQLFDLSKDPGETLNLARDKSAVAVLKQHRAMLASWIAETKDDFQSAIKEQS